VGTWAIAEVYAAAHRQLARARARLGRTLKAVFRWPARAELTTYVLALAIGVAALAAGYAFLRSRYGSA